ncbi:partitioning defective 3 homolog [Nephila pilipes]|uniref:Partitioning defective 3 homolog n=1 Tax=Nephila pilipes TaxID=299642 RepID=A0A8X6Q4A8_NEPPI|nr:partitioning defective 3 homolog [Nephila pilipes]
MSETLGRILGHARKYSFRKAEQKFEIGSPSSVVTIHNLKSSRDDGILYPDDQLNDVADDREQIIAVFEEGYSPLPPYTCGDVTSTSSVYTGSPDLFSVEVGSHGSNTEMEDNPPLGVTPLQVRRGSEPALNCLFPVSSSTDPNKRWSTAVVINSADPSQDNDSSIHENGIEDRVSPVESIEINGDSKMSSLTTTFSRGSGRLSILGNSAETYRWVEAADRQLMKDFNENFKKSTSLDAGSDTSSMSDEREKTIILKNESGPLGIHVVPDYDSKGRDTGLVIQGIEAGGRIDRDGRFHVGDRIIEINGRSLQSVSFQTAQEIFKSALKAPQIRLELVRGQGLSKTAAVPKKPPPPVYPKPTIGEAVKKTEEEGAALVEGEERGKEAGGVSTKVATVTPTKKVPASAMRRLASANTRRIGKMLTIELTKGSAGLGFSITTRDNPAGGNSPIYIKNVLPKGAAIEDGRLQPGDRLLEVNGTPMTGKSQTEAVSILRNISLGKAVQLVVSRQEVEETENTETENEVIPNKVEEEAGIFPWKYREILTFQIPLTDSHSAGLGVSVKGKSTSTANGSVDLGIFIKSVIPGGAASKDGRLQTNDQLVNINGISLLGMSNSNAMETLRNAMTQTDGPIRNAIILTIARRILVPNENGNDSSNPSTLKLELNPAVKGNGNLSDDSLDRNILKQNGIPRLTQLTDLDEIQKNTPGLPGCNPVIERLTGQASSEKSTSDLYGYSRHAVNGTDDKKSLYSGPISSVQGETVLIEGEYDPGLKKSVESLQLNGNVTDNLNVIPAGSQLSLDENNPGFARDGFGRQSMSEKRHAQLDARNTGTYQRNKKAREERQQQNFGSEEKIEDNLTSPVADVGLVPGRSEVVGPSLGLRKSSSLESLQTMLQELNKDDEALKRALQSGSSRSARGRGCNESFRAAVDRSYDAPATAATMETLDEESESGSHILMRSTEDPFQDDLLSMYCRNSKSSKKKSLLKGLGSVFKFGKNRKQSQDLKGKDEDSAQDSDFSQHQGTSSKEQDKLSDTSRESSSRRQLPQIPSAETVPNRQERMQSLREQYQRLHQRRQGQYPLEQKEEFYENELKEKEGNYAMPFEVIHGRSQSLDIHKEAPHGSSKVHPVGEPNRYSHYMNYKEIQQHINQRSHHGPSVKSLSKLDPKPLPSVLPDNTHSAPFFDHSSHHPMKKHSTSQSSDVSSNSLPRGTHVTEHGLGHTQGKPYFIHETHDHGNYSRMNVHHFYPNNKLYSHIVPGSKV